MAGPEPPRYQQWILDTIDSLRSRKARPDLERICRMVRRRHGPEPERTRAELEKLIQQRAVLRVSYKGSISYRNAARVQPPRARHPPAPAPPGPAPPPPAPAAAAPAAVSLREMVRYLGGAGGAAAAGGRLTRGRAQALPHDPGPGARGRHDRPRLGPASNPPRPGRAARGKKPGEEPLEEKDEDEEEDEEDDGASTLSSGSEAQAFEVPGGGRAEPLPLNGDCKDRHRGTPGGGGHARDWHPPDERSPDKASERPPGPERRHTKACSPAESACQQLGTAKKDGGSCGQLDRAGSPAMAGADPSVPGSPGRPGLQALDGTPLGCSSVKKEKPGDPVDWSVRDVVEYFTEAGFAEQAAAFQEQEIDGKALLLMQRSDVLTGLSIRLGPALKIYEHHVKALQAGHFDDDEADPFLA